MASDLTQFQDFLGRVRGGDGQAAAELVRCYEPMVLRLVRSRLSQPSLRRLLHPRDICQQVWADFFPRMSVGRYQLEHPGQLAGLLKTMARNHLFKEIKRLQAQRRGGVTARLMDFKGQWLADREPGPVDGTIVKELFQQVRSLLSSEEWYLVEQRAEGRTWADIAAELGGRADTWRVRFRRTYQRVVQRLELEV